MQTDKLVVYENEIERCGANRNCSYPLLIREVDLIRFTGNEYNKTIKADKMDFSELYLSYYPKLLRFAKEYVAAQEDAENIIHDVFESLWERRQSLPAIENINAYMFRLVRNKCIDHLRYKLSADKYIKAAQTTFEIELTLKLQSLDNLDIQLFPETDIEKAVSEAIDSLPDKCRTVFLLSRMEGMKYKDIAQSLGISVNTVENQISIALKKLRVKLKKYLSL